MSEYKPNYFTKGEAWFKPDLPINPDYKEIFTCWRCGKDVEVKYMEPHDRVFCDECFSEYKKEHEELIREYAKLKIKVMFENALRTMEKSKKVYMHEYLEASKKVYDMAMSESEKFMSASEIIVAIVLEEYAFEYYVNYPILDYKVDFYIPELKVCVEVDGALHQHKLVYDSKRDIEIRNTLGYEWEVVRIPVKYIEENPSKIIEAIEALANEKRRLRKKSQGHLPYGFSKRENKYYDKIFNNDKQ